MGEAIVFCKEDSLLREVDDVGIRIYFRKILGHIISTSIQEVEEGDAYLVL